MSPRRLRVYKILLCVCDKYYFLCSILMCLSSRYERGGSNANIDTRNSDIQKEISHAVSVRRLLKATS